MSITEFKFTPLKEFEWWRDIENDEGEVIDRHLIGQYHVGMTYNCTKQPVHDSLRKKCDEWETEGKIKKLTLLKNQSFKTIKLT